MEVGGAGDAEPSIAGIAEDRRTWPQPVWLIDPDRSSAAEWALWVSELGALHRGHRLEARYFESMAALPATGDGPERTPLLAVVDPGGETDPRRAIEVLRSRLGTEPPLLVVSSGVGAGEVFAAGASALLTKSVSEADFKDALRDLVREKITAR